MDMRTTDDAGGVGGSGYSLDALAEYLDRGRTPAIAAIEDSAECQAVLGALTNLRVLSDELIAEEARELGAPDENWFEAVAAAISREFRAGRDIPFPTPAAGVTLSITEGAVRELIRSAGDGVPGVLIGGSELTLDSEGAAHLAVTATVPATRPLRTVAEEVRSAIASAFGRHAPYAVAEIDVTIADVHPFVSEQGE